MLMHEKTCVIPILSLWHYQFGLKQSLYFCTVIVYGWPQWLLVLPVQVVPVYPLTHAHRSDEQTILTSRSVHCEVEVHAIPTSPEMELYPFAMIIRCPHTVRGSEKNLRWQVMLQSLVLKRFQ